MIENRDTIKRLSATAAGLGASGLLEREVGVNAGSSVVTGEDGQGSKDRSSSNSQFPPECTQEVIIALLNAVRKKSEAYSLQHITSSPSSDLFPCVCLETQGDSCD